MTLRSTAEILLAEQLTQAGIPFEREVPFAASMGRKWRADFMVADIALGGGNLMEAIERARHNRLLIEVDGGGYIRGRHSRGSGIEADAEKQSAAAILGYRVLRVTPKQVEDGRALAWVKQALGMEAAA